MFKMTRLQKKSAAYSSKVCGCGASRGGAGICSASAQKQRVVIHVWRWGFPIVDTVGTLMFDIVFPQRHLVVWKAGHSKKTDLRLIGEIGELFLQSLEVHLDFADRFIEPYLVGD